MTEFIKPLTFEEFANQMNILQKKKEDQSDVKSDILKKDNTIWSQIDKDLKNTVLSYIPNTAEVAFYGMVSGMEAYLKEVKKRKILALGPNPDEEKLEEILSIRPRAEKIAIKDAKLRTFITNDSDRSDMVAHVYDITQGVLKKGQDSFVCIDDSIVRGTTLKRSILRILSRLKPKRIIIVSSAPQIRYPDCYGIDMSQLGQFVAFTAAIGRRLGGAAHLVPLAAIFATWGIAMSVAIRETRSTRAVRFASSIWRSFLIPVDPFAPPRAAAIPRWAAGGR